MTRRGSEVRVLYGPPRPLRLAGPDEAGRFRRGRLAGTARRDLIAGQRTSSESASWAVPGGDERGPMADLGGMTGLGGGLTAANFIRFARVEATGKSPAYAVLAEAVAHDGAILDFLDGLPPAKRQPNLLFAAARFLLEGPVDPASLHELVAERASTVREAILSRSTQTNEPARCAVLLPALAAVPGPLAL